MAKKQTLQSKQIEQLKRKIQILELKKQILELEKEILELEKENTELRQKDTEISVWWDWKPLSDGTITKWENWRAKYYGIYNK